MKRTFAEIRETYHYTSYEEFVNHYNEMTSKGFSPNSDSSKPDGYVNREMNSYCAEYFKRLY